MRRQRLAYVASLLLVSFALLAFACSGFAKKHDGQDAAPPGGISHARVVSLSVVKGAVYARRAGSRKWTRATLEMPIEEGDSLATARGSFAEVQLENGSTLRVSELSRVDFLQMALAPDNGFVNHMSLVAGLVTLHTFPTRHDEFIINAGGASFAPHRQSEFRTDLSHGRLRVEVFRGHVLAADAQQSERLRKNQVLDCDHGNRGSFLVSSAIQEDAWDKWVEARDEKASAALYGDQYSNGLLYGWDDLLPFGGMGAPPPGVFGDDSF